MPGTRTKQTTSNIEQEANNTKGHTWGPDKLQRQYTADKADLRYNLGWLGYTETSSDDKQEAKEEKPHNRHTDYAKPTYNRGWQGLVPDATSSNNKQEASSPAWHTRHQNKLQWDGPPRDNNNPRQNLGWLRSNETTSDIEQEANNTASHTGRPNKLQRQGTKEGQNRRRSPDHGDDGDRDSWGAGKARRRSKQQIPGKTRHKSAVRNTVPGATLTYIVVNKVLNPVVIYKPSGTTNRPMCGWQRRL